MKFQKGKGGALFNILLQFWERDTVQVCSSLTLVCWEDAERIQSSLALKG